MNYLPHQQRVIDEKLQNDQRAQKLTAFISESPIFPTLPPAEQERMKEQNELMWQLSEILGKRIQAFGGEDIADSPNAVCMFMKTPSLTPLEEWAHKAAQELVSHTPLVDWHTNSKRLCEQIEGSDAIGYEWTFWHQQNDAGKAAAERLVILFDEFRAITERNRSSSMTDVTRTNKDFAATLLLTDPITHEALCPVQAPEDIDGALVLVVGNRDGSRRWKHSIRTEEL
jgi:hypothetical protein